MLRRRLARSRPPTISEVAAAGRLQRALAPQLDDIPAERVALAFRALHPGGQSVLSHAETMRVLAAGVEHSQRSG